ncbi:GEVED domain-containing protein [Novipirellula sp. SH528]|uniref:GEVED domain-containing protein n=1 Tax=Novipirellula sp. SH528 TaxID=3454466 RepID=UPI003F9FD6E6
MKLSQLLRRLTKVTNGRRHRSSRAANFRYLRDMLNTHRRFECLESRMLLSADFGDAPDLSTSTGTGDYQTLLASGGPGHTVVAGLFLGDTVDSDSGTLQNVRANADDVDGALPDDEDGVFDPANDLLGKVGAAPTVTLLVTNSTGNTATLAGWIDYNNDGVFDDATERTTTTVNTGTTDGRITLTFPTIPAGFTGDTYARFRLSTDASFVATPTSIGAVSDGEFEDYRFSSGQ